MNEELVQFMVKYLAANPTLQQQLLNLARDAAITGADNGLAYISNNISKVDFSTFPIQGVVVPLVQAVVTALRAALQGGLVSTMGPPK